MTTFEAVSIIEDADGDTNIDDVYSAFQHLIDTGDVWQLQGWFGRTAARLIRQGICTPAEVDAR